MIARPGKTARRRTALTLVLIAAILVSFAVRLVDIQVVNAASTVEQARENTGTTRVLAGQRGQITDMNGAVLATSSMSYHVIIDPSNIKPITRRDPKDFDKVLKVEPWPVVAAKIGAITNQPAADIEKTVQDAIDANKHSQYARITKSVTTEQMLELRKLDVPYLAMLPEESRMYPEGAVGGSLVGFVGQDSKDGKDVLVPRSGLELTQNSCLASKDGKESYLFGEQGDILPGSLVTTPAVNGGTLKTTINTDLQYYLQQLMAEQVQAQGAKWGTAFVVEVSTGAIRAAAEYPSLDPNDPGAVPPQDRGNHIFRDTFEPGSTFKAATAAMLLESGKANPMSTERASGYEEFPNGAAVGDAFSHPEYNYTLAGALIDSSNVALSKFGDLLSPAERHDYLQKFGVGKPTAVGFEGEGTGVLHDSAGWDNQTRYATTFGQAYTMTVPQIASFYSAIANDGVRMPLKLVESCTSADGVEKKNDPGKGERLLTENNAATMRKMIENVAEQGGVADLIKVPGYRIAAKTGTAQTIDPATGAYKTGVYDTSIIGFAPADAPKYVVMVTLKEPTKVTSSTATAPAFQKAMTQVMKTFRVLPSATPFTDPLPKFG